MSIILHNKFGDAGLLLATTDDQDFWISRIEVQGSLLRPTNQAGHVAVVRRHFRKLLQFLGDSVHEVNFPSVLGEYCIDHSRCSYNFSFERHDKLELRKVRIRALNHGVGLEDFKIDGSSCREKVGGSLQDCGMEIEGPVVPGEGKFVAPHAYLNNQDFTS